MKLKPVLTSPIDYYSIYAQKTKEKNQPQQTYTVEVWRYHRSRHTSGNEMFFHEERPPSNTKAASPKC